MGGTLQELLSVRTNGANNGDGPRNEITIRISKIRASNEVERSCYFQPQDRFLCKSIREKINCLATSPRRIQSPLIPIPDCFVPERPKRTRKWSEGEIFWGESLSPTKDDDIDVSSFVLASEIWKAK